MSKIIRIAAIICVLVAAVLVSVPTTAQATVVRAVFFFSPSCTHCHEVMEEHLPPLVAKYPGRLDIVGINVDEPVGSELYQSMLNAYSVTDDRIGVPTLVVGDIVLVGSVEIPEQFPEIIEQGLAAGGIDWPNIPGLEPVLAAQPADGISAEPQAPAAPPIQLTAWQKYMLEPVENTLAVIMLGLMIASVILAVISYIQGWDNKLFNWPHLTIPILCVLGIGIAGYLSYSYLTNTEVVCGPSGGCANVQNSPYAYLFGIIPVGLLGLLGYIAILLAWVVREYGPMNLRRASALAMWGFAWFGILFTIYLTFLEPFVIGASCLWCLGSALVMTLIFLASTGPAIKALNSGEDEYSDGDDEDLDDEPASAPR